MKIEIIISDEDNELLRGNYLTWESAEEGLGKLQRAFEKKQAQAEDMAEEASKGEPDIGETEQDKNIINPPEVSGL